MNIKEFFDLSSLIVFYFGFMFGMTIFVLIYLYTLIRSLSKKKYLVNVQAYDIDAKEIENLVYDYQENFRRLKLKGIGDNVGKTYEMSIELAKEIALRFFPKSSYPVYELSIDETLMLMTYVSKRIDEMLDHRGLRVFRKIKISQIMKWSNMKKSIDDNAFIKTDRKLGIRKKFSQAMGVLNVINPAYWVRKIIIDKSVDVVIKKICIMVFGIVGEETYKVYSKSLFNEEMHIDTGVDKFFEELRTDLDNEGVEEVLIKENVDV